MSENVLFRIKGLHSNGDNSEEQDEIEVLNGAQYYKKNDTHYILYEEIAEGTTTVTKNLVKISKDKVEITKKGGVGTNMCFVPGKRHKTDYYTPEGMFSMGMDTKSVDMVEEDETITVIIAYAMELNNEHVADCRVELQIIKK
ncbi:MAG: DUF1934 domain-containing protein [Lachnospiraceae bacterium]|nr:DUF1934 domain-containing protein [Lachnospiraceae bacterium]